MPAQITEATPVMSAAQGAAAFDGRDLAGVVEGGKYTGTQWTETQRSDGSMTLSTSNGFTDTRVSITRQGNTDCEVWHKLNNGAKACYRNLKFGDNQYASYNADGAIASIFHVIRPGGATP